MSIWQKIRKAFDSFAAAPPTRPADGRRLPSRRPMLLETLEDRRLLAIFSVNSLVDAVDAKLGDGLALDAAGKTTLRAAIMEANYASGADTINLPAGTYNLTLAGFGEGAAATGDLDIMYSVNIIGAGAASTIINASAVQDRIFDLSNSATVEIRGLTLTGGKANNSGSSGGDEDDGGAIRADFYNNLTIVDCVFSANSAPNSATGFVYGTGGAIFSSARTLDIQRCVFTGNYASNGGGAIAASGTVNLEPGVVTIFDSTFSGNSARDGGAIDSSHNLTVTGSTFSGNYGTTPGVGGGGAINSGNSSLVVTNSTFSGNSGPFGGAISTWKGSLEILNSTTTGNSASRGGGLEVSSSVVFVENTIIAGNTATTGPDVYGTVTSRGYNLVGNPADSSGFGATGDLLGANPLLGPLSNNGGPTWTHALLTGSPAIDAANTVTAPATDQRGVARYNSVADIGAFEWSPGGRISGTVFSDPNANGLRDTGEPGVPDWTVYLDENGNGQYDGDATTAIYVSSEVPKDIDTNDSNHIVTSVLTVPTIARFVSDVNVTVDIEHAYDADLNVFLIGPDGTRVELFTAVGGGGADFDGTVLDDEAATSIRTGAAPFTGRFRPEGKLLQFDDKRATGDWTLEITDTSPGLDGGALLNWSIEFTLGEPATLTDATGAYAFTDLPTGTYTVAETQRRGWLQTAPASDSYTLYLNPGGIISGRDFGNFELPSQTTTIPVSADGEGWDPELDGVYVVDTTSTTFRVGNTPSNDSGDMRGLAEFNLGSLPAHESVSDATLELNWSSMTGQSGVDYYCEVYGYAGNGAVTVDDVKQTATLVGRFFADFDNPVIYSIPIDPVFVQSMRAISQYVGFVLLMPEVNNAWIAFQSEENSWGDPYDPKLTVKTSVESLNGEIHGRKWNDADSDGIWDTGEPALAGWEIYLDLNEDGQYNSGTEPIALTDANGAYIFTDVAPGDYVVAERMKAGWEQTYPGVTPPPPVSQFQIEIDFDSGSAFSDTQKQIIQDAAARWSEIIIGDVPDVMVDGVPVDDLLIEASTFEGETGGILGQAGPTQLRPGSYLPVLGTMEFDTADIGALETSGQLDEVILHEMAHVLGFGTIWTQLGLLFGEGTTDPRFIGPGATAEYQAIFSTSETSVPLENTGGAGTQDAHWRETTFDTELMTGWLDPGAANPISRVTAAQFGDLGYEVYLVGADAYTKPALLQAGLRLDTGDWGKILTLEAEPVVLPESAIVAPQANFGGIEPLGGTNPNIPYTHWVSVSIGEIVEDIDFGNHLARTLTVQIAAAAVLENAGPAATTVTITRTGDTADELVVNLTSSDPTEATVPARATIPAGQASVTVSLDAVDDTLLDGTQTVTITATEIIAGGTGLDPGFGQNGYAATPLHVLTSDSRPGLVILPDGSIIGVGDDATGSDNAWQVVKVTPAGQLDATFGSGGVVATSFGTGEGLPHAVALQADGKIVVAGEADGGATIYEDIALARYNANGSLDTSFADGGKLRMEFDTGHASAYDLLVLPDGKLLIIGVGPLGVFLMSRFNSDGSFDTTFGTGGTKTIPYSTAGSAIYYIDAELMPDGRFVVVTQSTSDSDTWIVSRFNPDGSFDTSFDGDGRQQISFPRGYAYPYALALQSDGRIVAAGKVYDDYLVAPKEDMAATRLNDDGSIDTSFGANGRFMYDYSGDRDIANDVVVRPDGRIVLVGTLANPSSNKGNALGLVGLAPDGTLDPLFAQSGAYFGEPLASVFEEIEAGVLDEQGRLVTIAGYGDDIRVARFALGQDGLTAEATLEVTDHEGLGRIRGSKWEDLDADGVWDTGEQPWAGVTVYLDLDADGQRDAVEPLTVTQADGSYAFTGLAPGSYTVAELLPANSEQTFPGTLPSGLDLVSRTDTGAAGNLPSLFTSMSADGRFVAFASAASDIVPGVGGAENIFVRDRLTGNVEWVSKTHDGLLPDGDCTLPMISADGRFVVFESDATNLVLGDTNGFRDAFVVDRQLGTIQRVNVANSTGAQADAAVFDFPGISEDGRYVVFTSEATNLVIGDTNNLSDVFVRDLLRGTTQRLSVAADGTQGNYASMRPAISADGRYVVFESVATNLVTNDTNYASDVFLRDLVNGTITRVSVAAGGAQGNGASSYPAISADGRYITFSSSASNLVSPDPGGNDIFLVDRTAASIERITITINGAAPTGKSFQSAVSADGRFVAFGSEASNLVAGDTNNWRDSFLRDRQAGTTERVSVTNGGAQVSQPSYFPYLSGDGRFVGFSGASAYVPEDTNTVFDTYIRSTAAFVPGTHRVIVKAGEVAESIDFGNRVIREVRGTKYHDFDNDGVHDAGEPGLEGWTIYADDNQNGSLDANERFAVTDASGNYILAGLSAGTHRIVEESQTGWTRTAPTTGYYTVTVNDGDVKTGFDFLNYGTPGEVRGTKWHDLNGNGLKDAGEPGLEGWTIFLDRNGNDLLDAGERFTTTDANGDYVIANVPPGIPFSVVEVPKSGWYQTGPSLPLSERAEAILMDANDLVFDPHRNILYGTTTGQVLRYDLTTRTMLTPLPVGNQVILGADITPDGQYLYLAGGVNAIHQIAKIHLDSGAVTGINYAPDFGEGGPFDIAVSSSGYAILTTQYNGSGSVPLRHIGLADDSVTIVDVEVNYFGDVNQDTKIVRSGDHDVFYFSESNISSGPTFTYNAFTSDYLGQRNMSTFVTNLPIAIDRDGELVAINTTAVQVYDRALQPVRSKLGNSAWDGGIAFDPVRDLFYLIDEDSDVIHAYDTNTWSEVFQRTGFCNFSIIP